MRAIILFITASLIFSIFAQSPDYDRLIRQGKYLEIVQATEGDAKKKDADAKIFFARAAALNSLFAFEEASENFKKAVAAGINESAKLGGNSFSEWNSTNEASAEVFKLRGTFPAGKKDYQVAVRSIADSEDASIAVKALPKIAKLAEKFFGMKPKRIIFFILPHQDSTDEHWDKTKLTLSREMKGRGAYADGNKIVYFEDLHSSQDAKYKEETFAHEFAHAMHFERNQNMRLDKDQHPDWWVEGIAVVFASEHIGKKKQAMIEPWKREMQTVNLIRLDTLQQDFQDNARSRLHYKTAYFMIQKLIELKGQKVMRQIFAATTAAQSANTGKMNDILVAQAGLTEQALFDATIAELGTTTGVSTSGPQIKPKNRDYMPGDAILAKDNGRTIYEPARMLNKSGDVAYIRFYWGGQVRVPYSKNVIPFDWKRGMRVRCKNEQGDKHEVALEGVDYEDLIVKFPDGSSQKVKYEKCEDMR